MKRDRILTYNFEVCPCCGSHINSRIVKEEFRLSLRRHLRDWFRKYVPLVSV